MTQLTGIRYHGRTVRCNSEDDKTLKNTDFIGQEGDRTARKNWGKSEKTVKNPRGKSEKAVKNSWEKSANPSKNSRGKSEKVVKNPWEFSEKPVKKSRKRDDWKALINGGGKELRGEVPDFSGEGWARRKPKKK